MGIRVLEVLALKVSHLTCSEALILTVAMRGADGLLTASGQSVVSTEPWILRQHWDRWHLAGTVEILHIRIAKWETHEYGLT